MIIMVENILKVYFSIICYGKMIITVKYNILCWLWCILYASKINNITYVIFLCKDVGKYY